MNHLERHFKKAIEESSSNTKNKHDAYYDDLLGFCTDVLTIEFRNSVATESRIRIASEIRRSLDNRAESLISFRKEQRENK